MDEDNMYELNRQKPKDAKAKLLLLGRFDPEGIEEIRDPYYVSDYRDLTGISCQLPELNEWILLRSQDSNSQGFEDCYIQAVRCCKAFLAQIKDGKIWNAIGATAWNALFLWKWE